MLRNSYKFRALLSNQKINKIALKLADRRKKSVITDSQLRFLRARVLVLCARVRVLNVKKDKLLRLCNHVM